MISFCAELGQWFEIAILKGVYLKGSIFEGGYLFKEIQHIWKRLSHGGALYKLFCDSKTAIQF